MSLLKSVFLPDLLLHTLPIFCYGFVSGLGLMMNFGIRRARSEDWRAIHRIHERAVPYELHFLDEAARPRMESLERVFRGDLWVAEAASEILGFAACVGTEISWLYVDPSHFRRGIGRALLRHAVEHCGEAAHATVLANNVASLALMASEGFETAARETVSIVGYGVARVHKVRRVRRQCDMRPIAVREARMADAVT